LYTNKITYVTQTAKRKTVSQAFKVGTGVGN